MLRVVLADDEIHIRNLLKYLIHWDEHGLELVSDYGSGQAVVEHAKEDTPDLIISDIKMPGMDGLEMIRQVREILPNCRFVIISGFRDFEFAQKAVKLGVSDYILKPIAEDELNETLRSITRSASENVVQASGVSDRRQPFLSVLKNQNTVSGYMDANKRYGFHFEKIGNWYVLILQFCRVAMESSAAEHATRILKMLKKRLEPMVSDQEAFMVDDHVYTTVLQLKPEKEADFLRNLDYTYRSLLDEERESISPMRFYLSCGRKVEDIRDISSAYQSAKFFIAGRLRYGDNRVYIADTQQNASLWQSESKPIGNEVIREFRRALENSEEKEIRNIIESEFEQYLNNTENWALYEHMCLQFSDVLFSVLNRMGMPAHEMEQNRAALESGLENCDTIESLASQIIRSVLEITRRYITANKDNPQSYVKFAKEYIDAHYSEDITLTILAEKANINPAYLSSLFKEETGENYSAYLTRVRIEKAKELLCDISLNISQIAEQTGYSSPRYFSRIFESVTGIRPSEYRRLYLRKMNW